MVWGEEWSASQIRPFVSRELGRHSLNWIGKMPHHRYGDGAALRSLPLGHCPLEPKLLWAGSRIENYADGNLSPS